MRAEALAAVDWTPSPSAAAAALRDANEDDGLFFVGDDTVVDNPYGFPGDDDDLVPPHAVSADAESDARHEAEERVDDDGEAADDDELVETLVLLSGRSNVLGARNKPASLPGFRPPPNLDQRPRSAPALSSADATLATASASPLPAAWWTRPSAHWFFGGCAFVLSGLLWAVFAWFLVHRS